VLVGDKPFDIEADLDKKAAAVRVQEGRATVRGKGGQFYAVRIQNNSDGDVAVGLTIDGMSMFTFGPLRDKEGQPLSPSILVPKGEKRLIAGWYTDNKKEPDPLMVGRYSNRRPAVLQGLEPGKVTTLSVAFRKAVPVEPKEPKPEKPGDGNQAYEKTIRGLLPVSEIVSIRCAQTGAERVRSEPHPPAPLV